MSDARLILCEKTTRWAIAFRAALGTRVPIVERRSLSQCAAELRDSPRSIVALEPAATNAAAALDFVGGLGQQFPCARSIVLLDAGLAVTEPLWREAGALAVLVATRQTAGCARLIQRHLALARPLDEPNLRTAIGRRLPWARWANPEASHS